MGLLRIPAHHKVLCFYPLQSSIIALRPSPSCAWQVAMVASPGHPPSQLASTAFWLGGRWLSISTHKQQNMRWGGQRNHHSLHADLLTIITCSRKTSSASQDTLCHVHETTAINKWTMLVCKEVFHFLMLIFFTQNASLPTLASTTSSCWDLSFLLKPSVLETNLVSWDEQDIIHMWTDMKNACRRAAFQKQKV